MSSNNRWVWDGIKHWVNGALVGLLITLAWLHRSRMRHAPALHSGLCAVGRMVAYYYNQTWWLCAHSCYCELDGSTWNSHAKSYSLTLGNVLPNLSIILLYNNTNNNIVAVMWKQVIIQWLAFSPLLFTMSYVLWMFLWYLKKSAMSTVQIYGSFPDSLSVHHVLVWEGLRHLSALKSFISQFPFRIRYKAGV